MTIHAKLNNKLGRERSSILLWFKTPPSFQAPRKPRSYGMMFFPQMKNKSRRKRARGHCKGMECYEMAVGNLGLGIRGTTYYRR